MTNRLRATFSRLIDQARLPERADRSAGGTLSTRATRYCDAVTSASAFGWWLFPPMDFALLLDGADIFWHYDGQRDWLPLDTAQFPGFARRFDSIAPAFAQGCSPPFLTVLPEQGILQVWTGLFARSAPDWSFLIRAPVNLPQPGGYTVFDGIVEADQWFGPLFVNIRLNRTGTPVRLRGSQPIAQLQPIPREAYADHTLNEPTRIPNLESWSAQDWADYNDDIIKPNSVADYTPGRYALTARRRRKKACPLPLAVQSQQDRKAEPCPNLVF